MVRLVLPLLVLASMASAAPSSPPSLAKRDIAAEYSAHPQPEGFMTGSAGKQKRSTLDQESPAILAEYKKHPNLEAFMRGGAGKRNFKRDSNDDGLCGPNGTEILDIRQTTLNDCWLASTMLTMAYVNPWWPISRFRTLGGQRNVSEATVVLTPPGGGAEYLHLFKTSDLSSANIPFSTADQHWWPAAIEAAVAAYGSSSNRPNILLDGGRPADGVYLLSGYTAQFTPQGSSQDVVWEHLQNPDKSPVLITTLAGGTKVLQSWHVYGVLAATVQDGVRTVAVRNPMATDESGGLGGKWYTLDEIYNDIINVVYIPNGANGPQA